MQQQLTNSYKDFERSQKHYEKNENINLHIIQKFEKNYKKIQKYLLKQTFVTPKEKDDCIIFFEKLCKQFPKCTVFSYEPYLCYISCSLNTNENELILAELILGKRIFKLTIHNEPCVFGKILSEFRKNFKKTETPKQNLLTLKQLSNTKADSGNEEENEEDDDDISLHELTKKIISHTKFSNSPRKTKKLYKIKKRVSFSPSIPEEESHNFFVTDPGFSRATYKYISLSG